jgi:hypothetical protein
MLMQEGMPGHEVMMEWIFSRCIFRSIAFAFGGARGLYSGNKAEVVLDTLCLVPYMVGRGPVLCQRRARGGS